MIDAIDECNYYAGLLKELSEIFADTKSSVKLILSSSEDTDIKHKVTTIFPSNNPRKVTLHDNKDEIKYYIDIQVKHRGVGARLLDHHCDTCQSLGGTGTRKSCKERTDLENRLVELLFEKSYGM